ncbi:MAG: ComEA family DNA-binding protein [Pseudomonadales bacterium]|jgi:competence protein ComEA|nr:ComEA family DNA-binding protein [Pseudomonadales bacterium]
MTTNKLSRVQQLGVVLALLWSWQGIQAQTAPAQAVQTEAVATAAAVSTLQVNINQADAETLADVLVGVGPAKAQAIVEYREEHGPFQAVDDLIEVNGIGEATLRTNRDRIRLE